MSKPFIPEAVTVGEEIAIPQNGGQPAKYEVLPSCEVSDGHWTCAVHGGYPLHNAKIGGVLDWRKDCRAVWVCHEHGPEAP